MPPARDRRRRTLAVGLAIVICAGIAGQPVATRPTRAQSPSPDPAMPAIKRVLDDQTAAWNRGDLDAFLAGYWHSPKVVFQSGGTRNVGFDAMRDRYRETYQSNGRAMGKLAFSDLEIESLAPDAAFVRGRYTLSMADGSRPTGLFTLIMRRLPDGWKIVHDHTSAAPTEG